MEAAKNIKLTYFNIYGLGELPRILLNYAGKEFTDVRIDWVNEWPSLRDSTPLGVLPLLEVDGEIFIESTAIGNFLAKEFGLYPVGNREQMVTDVVISLHRDIFKIQEGWYYLDDGPDKIAKSKEAHRRCEKYLKYLEGMLEKNGTGYFVGDSVTFADLVMLDVITGYSRSTITLSAELYPNIAKNNANVLKLERIKKYVDNRPFRDS